MLKETVAVFLVVAGVAIALTDTRDDVALPVRHDARRLALDVSDDLRLDAALIRLPMEYPGLATGIRCAIGEGTLRDRTVTPRKRVARRACPPHSSPAPDVARKLSSEPGGSSTKLAG